MDNQFYPTPTSIVVKMLSLVPDYMNRYALEPSAGSGSIAGFLNKKQLKLLEIDPKTNDQWKVNKKVILPDAVKNEYISVSIRDYVTDIDRAMYGLQGRTLEISNTIKSKVCSMHRNRTLSFNTWYDSEHFEFKLFKKGTLHLRFKDDELYKIFNQVACKSKSWLTT